MITTSAGATVFTEEHIHLFEMMSQRGALKLEILGLRHSRGSVYARIKQQYGFRGTRKAVLAQLESRINEQFPGAIK